MSTKRGFIRNSSGQVYLVDETGKVYPIDPHSCPAAKTAALFPDAFISSISKSTTKATDEMQSHYCSLNYWDAYGKYLLIGGIILGGGLLVSQLIRKGQNSTNPIEPSPSASGVSLPELPVISPGEIPTL